MKYYSFDNSKCLRGYLHDFKIVGEYGTHTRERCTYCRKEMMFSKQSGRNTSLRYLSYHIKNALTPQHYLFYLHYPQYKK